MKVVLTNHDLALTLSLVIALAAAAVYSPSSVAAEEMRKEEAVHYTCPMPEHADVISDKPGRCPKCGMNLVPAKMKESSDAQLYGSCADSVTQSCSVQQAEGGGQTPEAADSAPHAARAESSSHAAH